MPIIKFKHKNPISILMLKINELRYTALYKELRYTKRRLIHALFSLALLSFVMSWITKYNRVFTHCCAAELRSYSNLGETIFIVKSSRVCLSVVKHVTLHDVIMRISDVLHAP